MNGFNMMLVFITIRVRILCKRARQKRSMLTGSTFAWYAGKKMFRFSIGAHKWNSPVGHNIRN